MVTDGGQGGGPFDSLLERAARAARAGVDVIQVREKDLSDRALLAVVSAAVAVPVHAIGGVTPARVPALRAAGARGGAAIRPFLEGPADAIIQAFRDAEGGRPFPT